ncbi:cyclic nucleotide-binding domain-containing protein [Hyalangium versicolor]|uniref:cyclic nucleotide-binding domain-containing protein n=1 Tax=Hyalangium versicolor TaxID=2861190 RepID=UPI001CCB22C3|nr:cyclic nucleotide-binding domain-containing protein [Hyalangium versicolor]
MSRPLRQLSIASQDSRSAFERSLSHRATTSRQLADRDAESVSSSLLRRAKDKATSLLAQGELEEALKLFQSVAVATPGEPLWRQKVAEILQRLGRTREAIAEYEVVAETWAKTGWLLRAIAMCKAILQLDPNHTRTQALLANLHTRREQPRGQVGTAGRPVALPPGLKRARDSREAESLPTIPFFSSLGREVFLEVLAGVERRQYKPGEFIVREGTPGSSMFMIVEGSVSVVRQGEQGQPLILASLGEGELFGEMALLCEGPRLSSVVAMEDTVLLEFTRERMENIATRYPQLAEIIQQLYQERLLANVLRSNPLFAGWPEPLRQNVAASFTPISVKAGEEIISRGQQGHTLFLVLRGRCAVFHHHVDGNETPYPDMAEGAVFGEISLLRSRLATASVRAQTPCLLLKLERATLDQLLPRHPALYKELQRLSAERMLRTTMLLCGHPIHLGDTRV